MAEWSAEVVVDEPLVRRLLGQFPDLAVESLERLAAGWDNVVWVVNGEWAFRFPQREKGAPGFRRELATLPLLAPLVPLPVPEPVFVGRPAGDYPWPFFGSRLLPGQELCDARLDDTARTAIALQLAPFLRRLHGLELGLTLPVDPNARGDARRVERTRANLADIAQLGLWRAPTSVGRLLGDAERLPAPSVVKLVHGDLHFRHVLVQRERVTGVIDWGDVCLADPALDLQLLWSFVPPAGRGPFLDAYGSVDDAQLVRARVLALSLSSALAAYGRTEGLAAVEREGVEGLERAMTP